MFQKAFAAKKALLAAGTVTTTSLWDFIGLGEIRSKLGGKVRIVVTTCKWSVFIVVCSGAYVSREI